MLFNVWVSNKKYVFHVWIVLAYLILADEKIIDFVQCFLNENLKYIFIKLIEVEETGCKIQMKKKIVWEARLNQTAYLKEKQKIFYMVVKFYC